MGQYTFKLPDLGEGIVESEVTQWHVKVGDTVEEDQHIADVMTDKAVVEVSAPVSGTVVFVACEAGEIVSVGSELIRFDVDGEGNTASKPSAAESENTNTAAEQEPPPSAEQAANNHAETAADKTSDTVGDPCAANPERVVLTSPSVRRNAREQGVDLSLVPGSGKEGRVSHADLEAFIAAGGQQVGGALKRQRSGTRSVKLSGLRRVIAQKMLAAKRNIPHYSYIEEIDVTNLEQLRAHLNENRESHQTKLTLLPFVMQALTKILPDYPHCNAHFDDNQGVLTEHEAVNIGIATMTDKGLMVPVIKHTEAMDIWQCAAQVTRLSEAVRANQATPDDLKGSTITITSLGAIGGIATTPVINAPETAIIGINKMQQRPVVRDGEIVIRSMMNLSSSFDHRVVDGYDGALLVQALKRLLENPGAIFV